MDRSEQIEVWQNGKWRVGKKGATFKDIKGYRVAVMPTPQNPGVRTWVINKPSEVPEWSEEDHDDEEAAMQAVLERLRTYCSLERLDFAISK